MNMAMTRPDMPDPSVNADAGTGDVFVFPTSFPQRRLWFLDQLTPDSWAYNLTSAWRLRGALNVQALEKCFSEILGRHEILRTTFKAIDGEPMQIVSGPQKFHLPVIDLRTLSGADREIRVQEFIEDELKHVFDLERGPLLRLSVLKLSDNEHVLLKNTHHIITDSWSEDIFVEEWTLLYDSFSKGQGFALAPLPIQYADFSEWQQQALKGDELARQLAYWQKKLGGELPALHLPADHPRPETADYAGAVVNFSLSPQVSVALRELARKERVTLFIMMLTAYKVLLHRYSGQHDIIVGTPVTNRNREELEHLIGFFLNTLVLRTDFSGNPPFLKALASVRDTALGAFSNQEVPFEMLVEKLQPERNLSQHPLCQVMFVLLRAGETSEVSAGITVSQFDIVPNTSKFDLVLSLTEKEDGIDGSFVYGTSLFDKATMDRMVQDFQVLLESIADGPSRPIDELPLLDEASRRQLLVEWNDTARPCSLIPVHDLVDAQCARTPEAVAVVHGNESMTYGELYRRSGRLAAHLQAHGAGSGKLIGVCVDRTPDMFVALLGILRSGAAYVPLDPDFPPDRLSVMIEDAIPPIIITQRNVEASLPKSAAHIIYLEDELPGGTELQPPQVSPDDLAYVLFTSGSTGRPKGVGIPHGALTNLLESMRERPGMVQSDTLLAVTTLSFDIAGLEIFLPLICGAKIVLAGRDAAMDPRQVAEIIGKEGITVLQATPSTWRGLLAAEWKGSPNLKILCGGEAMTADLAEHLITRCASLWNVYGPTETTIWSTLKKVESVEGTVSIGHPIANTRIYILNESLQPQPVGVYGELHIGGLGVARGYLGQPELTAKKFIPDPFGAPGDRLYKTGDLARYRSDGSIEFLGRLDHQVKVRGYRIELAEIESSLGRHPAVQQCVVIARDDRLVAYIVKRGETEEAGLRDFLKSKLPEYMIPSVFEFIDALPMTPNGKVDRKALPALDCVLSRHHEFVAPRNDLEENLAAIWSHALGVERISMNDDFFELGGHSLMAVGLFIEIEKKLGHKLPLATLFQAPTIGQIAAIIEKGDWSAPWSPLVPIKPSGDNQPFFCIHGADGAVLFYNKLASLLAPEQPVYGLQAQGLDGGQIVHGSMEAMAALYIKEMRAVQPRGPYFLGGYSFGGLLALEIARQLRAQGLQVAMLVLFDTNNPDFPPRRYTLRERIVLRTRVIAGWSLRRKVAFVLDRGWRKLAVMVLLRKEAIEKRLYKSMTKGKEVVPVNYRILHVREANEHAMGNYHPGIYDGTLTLVRAENPNDGFEFDSQLGWGGLATGGIEIYDVKGQHDTIFKEPHVHELAVVINNCIKQARQRFGLQQ